MIVKSLYLADFRNIAEETVNFSPELNLLIGNNAQGKTSFLEALYFIANCKSFRTSRIKDLIRWGSEGAVLKINFEDRLINQEVQITLTNQSRKITANQKKITNLADYLGTLRVICFSPENLSLVKGSPNLRREFIDRHLVDLNPRALTSLVKYNQALKNKNQLLKNRQANRINIEAWNKILAELSLEIITLRQDFIAMLNQEAQIIHQAYGEQDGKLEIEYSSAYGDPDSFNKQAILDRYNNNFEKELILKNTVEGPHRDDLMIKINQQLARSFASQGQARSIALSLKFAVVKMIEDRYEEAPIIILDDLDSELDQERLKQLYQFLLGKKRQVFISGTSLPVNISEFSANFFQFEISNGQARPIN